LRLFLLLRMFFQWQVIKAIVKPWRYLVIKFFYALISVAEGLESENKISLEKIFKQVVNQVYKATEGFLASTCQFGTLHFHEDWLLVEKEYLDNKRFHPIITDFTRTSQPIVRYRLNDIIHERQTPCPCGSIMLAIDHIEGRSDDIFEFLDKNQKKVLIFPDFFRKAVITASATIEEYAVEQQAGDFIGIFLKTQYFEEDVSAVTLNIHQLLSARGITNFRFVFSEDFPVLQDKKLRRSRKIF
jgi:putative adenylate-forming enzyme